MTHWTWCTIPMILAVNPVLAADPSASAKDKQPRVWAALSGNRIELDGTRARLSGVTCATADTPEGRDAKALLNTFLRAGHVRCALTRTTGGHLAECTVNGHSINTEMQGLPGCAVEAADTGRHDTGKAEQAVERRICPADPDALWRRPTGLGPIPEHLRLVLYSLHLSWRERAAHECGAR